MMEWILIVLILTANKIEIKKIGAFDKRVECIQEQRKLMRTTKKDPYVCVKEIKTDVVLPRPQQ